MILIADIINWALWNSLPPVKFLTGDLLAIKIVTEVSEMGHRGSELIVLYATAKNETENNKLQCCIISLYY